ncbi:hydantoinase/oxoprolinase family protein [Xylophilus rhododendri]|uniref:Hydantoinase/oxoprolinase family protein n=1 Tax=Xylophilus rhododendri TaxID=2697032 RepID=A0A857J242_9BURK|nr:hydantoinase/oxoprolinase family protein [Xylophilus rhododendri]QHI97687.1 hydantoinase/oxoprolinase family protein [Xylophilus rhododendri]
MTSSTYSLGIDIGGTFTDIVVYAHETGRAVSHKELTTPAAPHKGVLAGVSRLFQREGLDYACVTRVIHATTLFTNALIERKGARTGLITTAGFRDTLEMAREHKYELYDLHIELPKALVPRHLRLEAAERIGPDGSVLTPLDEAGLLAAADQLVAEGLQSIAIVFLHAYANPVHELRARELIAARHPGLFVSISSEVSPQIREYERSVTTVANAYVKPLADGYLDLMSEQIRGLGITAPLFMMLSNGGLTHVEEAKRVPIQLLESGPAAGALAGAFFGERSGIEDVLAFDMGGTTAKLAIVDGGEPLIAHQFEASREKRLTEGSGLPISISTIELIEIGAGGGSLAQLDAMGLLKVGPESAASDPGPVCYGRGGKQPTVTDANLILGFLDPEGFAGGTITLDTAAAEAAMAPMAAQAGVSVPELAWGIHSIVNENMAGAARVHVAERGHNAARFSMLLTGGGGPLHGCEVARRLGTLKVVCPPGAGVASALGLLMAPARVDRMATVARRLSRIDWAELDAAFAVLEQDALGVIAATLSDRSQPARIVRSADLRFVGQGFEVVTELPAGPYDAGTARAVVEAFDSLYLKTFTQTPPKGEVEIVNIRVAVSAQASASKLDAGAAAAPAAGQAVASSRRRIWVGAHKRYEEVPVFQREALPVGFEIAGPAIVQEASSTLVLPAGSLTRVDGSGSLIVDLTNSIQKDASTAQHKNKASEATERDKQCA